MKKSHASQSHSASTLISNRIAELGRGETLGRIRTLIKEADPDVVEELKWVQDSGCATTGSGLCSRFSWIRTARSSSDQTRE
jgi:hypothetical protein